MICNQNFVEFGLIFEDITTVPKIEIISIYLRAKSVLVDEDITTIIELHAYCGKGNTAKKFSFPPGSTSEGRNTQLRSAKKVGNT